MLWQEPGHFPVASPPGTWLSGQPERDVTNDETIRQQLSFMLRRARPTDGFPRHRGPGDCRYSNFARGNIDPDQADRIRSH